jgi:hypothetical protein
MLTCSSCRSHRASCFMNTHCFNIFSRANRWLPKSFPLKTLHFFHNLWVQVQNSVPVWGPRNGTWVLTCLWLVQVTLIISTRSSWNLFLISTCRRLTSATLFIKSSLLIQPTVFNFHMSRSTQRHKICNNFVSHIPPLLCGDKWATTVLVYGRAVNLLVSQIWHTELRNIVVWQENTCILFEVKYYQ